MSQSVVVPASDVSICAASIARPPHRLKIKGPSRTALGPPCFFVRPALRLRFIPLQFAPRRFLFFLLLPLLLRSIRIQPSSLQHLVDIRTVATRALGPAIGGPALSVEISDRGITLELGIPGCRYSNEDLPDFARCGGIGGHVL